MLLHTNMLCKRLWVYKQLDQKWLDIRFLFLSKKDMNLNPWHSRTWILGIARVLLLKFQLCMICGSNFFWVHAQITSKAVHEVFNFSLKLVSGLSKQLDHSPCFYIPPLVFTTSGGMEPECTKVSKRLAAIDLLHSYSPTHTHVTIIN